MISNSMASSDFSVTGPQAIFYTLGKHTISCSIISIIITCVCVSQSIIYKKKHILVLILFCSMFMIYLLTFPFMKVSWPNSISCFSESEVF